MTAELRTRLLARYVSTHASVATAAAEEGLARRRPYLDRLVRDHFPPDRSARILDLGCGHGAIVEAARRAGYLQVEGVDASPEQVAAAAKLGITGVRQGDLFEALEGLGAGSLDVIIVYDLLHYFAPTELLKIVDGVARALKPGGRWIVHVPNGESPFAGRMRYWDCLATGAFTRASIAQLLLASGFASVRSFEDRPAPHGLKSLVRAGLWQVIRLGLRLYLMVETGERGEEAIFSQCLLAVAIK